MENEEDFITVRQNKAPTWMAGWVEGLIVGAIIGAYFGFAFTALYGN